MICEKTILRFEMTQEAMKLLVGAWVYDFFYFFQILPIFELLKWKVHNSSFVNELFANATNMYLHAKLFICLVIPF